MSVNISDAQFAAIAQLRDLYRDGGEICITPAGKGGAIFVGCAYFSVTVQWDGAYSIESE